MLIRLLPGDYAGAGKGQQRHKATKASPCFEKTVTFRGKPGGEKSVVQIPRVLKNSNGSQMKAMDRAGLESSSWPAVGAWLGQIRALSSGHGGWVFARWLWAGRGVGRRLISASVLVPKAVSGWPRA